MKLLSSKYFIPTVILWNQTWQGLSQKFFFITTVFHIALFYFNAYFLYPRLLTRKKWWLYIICIVSIVLLSYRVKIYFLKIDENFILTPYNERMIFFSLFPLLIGSIIFRLINDRIRFERLEKEAKAQRLDAELRFLRSQISPHFLFNMMTNMVSLARQKSDLLEPSLIKLSHLLRYMLYDSTEEKISVNSEIYNIKNYVALQHLRFGEDVRVDLKIENDCAVCLVEPMLLVPFIENAFKHGVGLLKEPFIEIKLSVKEHQMEFEVVNNFNAANHSKDKNSGIGLANVKSRLKLLYPEKYILQIDDSKNVFSVQLKINLL
jgi:two-component system, LytTR family, sensor kinase